MERAPEPTMEEILASIRRIIADDETPPGQQRAAPAREPEAVNFDGPDQPADTHIIDDIARVLSGSGQGGEPDDDILDLTKELGLAPVETEFSPAEQAEPESFLDMLPDDELEPDAAMALSNADLSFEDVPTAPAANELSVEEAIPAPSANELSFAQPAPALSANDEATSALEQAIAALRAGRLQSSPPPSPPQLQPEPTPAPELVLTELSQVELVIDEPTPEDEVFTSAPEEPAPGPSFEEMVAASETFRAEPETSWSSDFSDWQTESEPADELDFVAERMGRPTNGVHAPAYTPDALSASGKTLEDSVKEMLRPVLRQWLDENMSRVLTAALREELREGRMGRGEG